jgi:hypothetical protein
MSGKLIILFLKCFSKEFFLFQRVILPKRKTNFVLAVFEKKKNRQFRIILVTTGYWKMSIFKDFFSFWFPIDKLKRKKESFGKLSNR